MEPTARAVYQVAADPECALPGGALLTEIRAELHRFSGSHHDLAEREDAARCWSGERAERYRDFGGDAGAVSRAVLDCAPLASLTGAWLQWLTSPGNAEDAVALRLLALYAADVGVGRPHASRGSAFRALLRHLGLFEQAVPAARLALDHRIGDAAFVVPAVLLAMSRRPGDFRAEITGADLCLRAVGLLPALTFVRDTAPTAADWTALDPGAARQDGADPAGQCRLAAAECDGERVALGFDWTLGALTAADEDLHAELTAARAPAYEMAALLRRRAREGAVYHRDFTLAGRPLAEWLAQARSAPEPLLDALAGSRLVRPGRAEASPLVTSLISDRGPMFRVFAEQDVAVIRRWIDSLPAASAEVPRLSTRSIPPRLPSFTSPGEDGREPADLRAAYHALQHRTGTPALRRYSTRYVRRWLARAGTDLDSVELPLPGEWPAEGLRPWLSDQHERHAHEFELTADAPLPSREALVDSIVQLAPLTLIDGAWLQGFTDYELAATDIGHALFDTYWDELGNGRPDLNHPRIYREVLAEMDVRPPPTGSPEFAAWPGFREESFALPVFWLCIGRFPRTFLPEVLGLNLAMELSGVGGSYRRARIALRHHGFSTRFVDIHNTIDNVATGHSAWAADAVDTYLSALPPAAEAGARAAAWTRVRTGYRALTASTGWLARARGRVKEMIDG
ncbi:iron-containing redox enzyme family protein [Amycolatopsis magusensis]|uniref:iron-containing redox enzyme family protein n=1 Tax=Amycolatopsis magusensis TaxID=882444 RepID=UPI003C2F4D78